MVDDLIVFGSAAVTTPVQVFAEGREDKATITIVEEPLHGVARITEAGELEYTPEAGFVGEDSLVTDKGSRGTRVPARTRPWSRRSP